MGEKGVRWRQGGRQGPLQPAVVMGMHAPAATGLTWGRAAASYTGPLRPCSTSAQRRREDSRSAAAVALAAAASSAGSSSAARRKAAAAAAESPHACRAWPRRSCALPQRGRMAAAARALASASAWSPSCRRAKEALASSAPCSCGSASPLRPASAAAYACAAARQSPALAAASPCAFQLAVCAACDRSRSSASGTAASRAGIGGQTPVGGKQQPSGFRCAAPIRKESRCHGRRWGRT